MFRNKYTDRVQWENNPSSDTTKLQTKSLPKDKSHITWIFPTPATAKIGSTYK